MARKNDKKKPAGKKKKPADKKTTALATRGDASVAVAEQFVADASLGFEHATKEAYAIPFLVLLQTNSPQCSKKDDAYVEGAEAGMFMNSASGELHDEALVVPAYYQRQFVEWTPRDQGGGFRGAHDPESVDLRTMERDVSGRFVMPNGNYLADTRYHFCLLLTEEGPQPIVIGLTSTQLKTSRNWMTAMRDRRMKNPKTGELQPVPMMANVWRLSSVTQSNEKGTWQGIRFAHERMLDFPAEAELYKLAKELHHQIATGAARMEEPVNVVSADEKDEPLI